MYKNKKIIGLIPARGGSKGIPHKNIINFCGKPLISYTIEAGKKSKYIDYLLVSTDDKEIAKISEIYGAEVPFMRPAEFASDTSKTIDAVIHCIQELKNQDKHFDILVLLQPTQPLRTSDDIDNSIEKYFDFNCQPLVSVSEVNDNPLLIRTIENDSLKTLLDMPSTCRRQDMPKYYRVNGAIYINEIEKIDERTSFNDNSVPYIMEKEHSIDIDELSDLFLAEFYYKNLIKQRF